MDIKAERLAFRQKRLRELIDTHYHGVHKRFSDASGVSETLVSRYLSNNQKSKKGIGEDTVRKIEENTGYFGWFSMGGQVKATVVKRHARSNVQRLCDIADGISDPGLDLIIEYAQMIKKRYPLTKAKKRKAA
jgi:hypothetical protein